MAETQNKTRRAPVVTRAILRRLAMNPRAKYFKQSATDLSLAPGDPYRARWDAFYGPIAGKLRQLASQNANSQNEDAQYAAEQINGLLIPNDTVAGRSIPTVTPAVKFIQDKINSADTQKVQEVIDNLPNNGAENMGMSDYYNILKSLGIGIFDARKVLDFGNYVNQQGKTQSFSLGGKAILRHGGKVKVQRGDTFYGIAKKHKVSIDDLKRYNPHIKDISRINPGDVINLEETTETKKSPKDEVKRRSLFDIRNLKAYKLAHEFDNTKEIHTIKSGETLWGIARKNNISLDELLENNPQFHKNKKGNYVYHVGDKVNIIKEGEFKRKYKQAVKERKEKREREEKQAE